MVALWPRAHAMAVAFIMMASACADSTDDASPTEQPADIATSEASPESPTESRGDPIAISLTVDGELWRGIEERRETGWWDPITRSGGLRDLAGEVVWLEDDGVVLRPEINPNADTDWTAYDIDAWGAATPDDDNYWGIGTAMQGWATPTIESIVRLRTAVGNAADVDGLGDGDHVVNLAGATWLDTLDELVTRRALTHCESAVPIEITLASGVITRMVFTTRTGVLDRTVEVEFGALIEDASETTDWPDDAVIATTRPPSETDDRPRAPAECDWPDREPVTIERVGCEEPPDDPERHDQRSDREILERRALAIPGAPGGASISPWGPIAVEDLVVEAAARELVVTSLTVQVPTSNRGVFTIVGIAPVAEQRELDRAVQNDLGSVADTSGPSVVVGFTVEGTWADIASWADDCAIFTTGMPDRNQQPATPSDFPAE